MQQSCKISETKCDRIERETDKFTTVVEDLKPLLSTVDKTARKENQQLCRRTRQHH